jgi:hypothetical protein
MSAIAEENAGAAVANVLDLPVTDQSDRLPHAYQDEKEPHGIHTNRSAK